MGYQLGGIGVTNIKPQFCSMNKISRYCRRQHRYRVALEQIIEASDEIHALAGSCISGEEAFVAADPESESGFDGHQSKAVSAALKWFVS